MAGGVGVGLFAGYEEAAAVVQVEPGEEPRPRIASRYQELYHVFQETYVSLVPVYERMAAG